MDCTDTVLSLGTDKPGKLPQKFVIQSLALRGIGAGQPMDFTATLTNPKPVGQIETRGYFGPWKPAHPGATALGGTYSFHDADLGTIKGIGGILSSEGKYQGTLDKIVVDGKTDTPDFQVKISGHKVPLHTEFHAIVDGTDGNTYLQPVKAQFLHSFLTAQGYVVRDQAEPGRHVYLDVAMDQARIEDLLRLAVRTDPPVMDGQVKLHTKLDLPPGPQDVAHRLRLQGNFAIINGRFSSEKIQHRIDELSLRSQGEVELATQQARDGKMQAGALPDAGRLQPGGCEPESIECALRYSRHEHQARRHLYPGWRKIQLRRNRRYASYRVTDGWGLERRLVDAVDKYFQKNGAGTEVPFKIDGTKSDPHFGLDFDRLKKK